MEDETEERMEYEGNKVSQEFKNTLKAAENLLKKTKKEYTLMQEEISKAKEWSKKMAELEIFDPNQSRLTKEEMIDKIAKFKKKMGMFDSFFAQVHGVEAGLLPTEEQIGALVQIIEQMRILWGGSGWSTDQPK
jgi:hypothetical protein